MTLNTRNCRHIQAAKKDAEWIKASTSSDPAPKEMIAAVYAANVARRAISHLPISPPEWCRLPTDNNNIPRVSFQAGRNLPSRFILDSSSRCSCGETKSSLTVSDSELTIHTSFGVINKIIEINYYSSCRNTKNRIDLDLNEYGIFN
jgi:KDZ transposase family protein